MVSPVLIFAPAAGTLLAIAAGTAIYVYIKDRSTRKRLRSTTPSEWSTSQSSYDIPLQQRRSQGNTPFNYIGVQIDDETLFRGAPFTVRRASADGGADMIEDITVIKPRGEGQDVGVPLLDRRDGPERRLWTDPFHSYSPQLPPPAAAPATPTMLSDRLSPPQTPGETFMFDNPDQILRPSVPLNPKSPNKLKKKQRPAMNNVAIEDTQSGETLESPPSDGTDSGATVLPTQAQSQSSPVTSDCVSSLHSFEHSSMDSKEARRARVEGLKSKASSMLLKDM